MNKNDELYTQKLFNSITEDYFENIKIKNYDIVKKLNFSII